MPTMLKLHETESFGRVADMPEKLYLYRDLQIVNNRIYRKCRKILKRLFRLVRY